MSYTSDQVISIIGFALFAISELLPFLNIPSNGFLHVLSLGFTNAFSTPQKDIQFAQDLIQHKSDYASIVNNININPKLYDIINKISQDPALLSSITSLLNNPQLLNNVVALQNINDLSLSQESIDAIKPLMIRIEK